MQARLMNNLPGMAYRCRNDHRWTMLFASDGCRDLTGYTPEAFTSGKKNWADLIPPGDREAVHKAVQAALARRDPYQIEYRITDRAGRERWVWEQGEGVFDTADGPSALVGFVTDVTKRHAAADALRESEARARAILETTVDAIITIDERGRIESFNQAAERIFGYTVEELKGKNVKVLMPEPYHSEHDGYMQAYRETGRRRIIGIGREVVGRRKDGTTFPIDLAVSEVQFEGRRIFTGVIRDISERRALEREVLRISDEERRRIGQDLHDGLGQMLTGIGLISQSLARKLEANGLAGADEVAEIADLVKEADRYARDLSRGLVPVELDAQGLSAALQQLAKKAESLMGVECIYEEAGDTKIVDDAAATHLYRIAQEAVSNAVRHGRAGRVEISLSGEELLRLRVADDGAGFEGKANGEGMGLRIMRHRAGIMGAALEVTSAAGEGTTVTCSLARRGRPMSGKTTSSTSRPTS